MSKRTRDAEELKRRKMARLRFRNLIRSVALNRIWLAEAGEQKLSLNVKKNIALLVRTQRKIGLLTLAEKSVIRTHHTLRTIEERKTLVSLMANLRCFSNLPPKVRARLAKCVKFMIITPGRKLMKEGNPPLMVYFLLTGEVEVSKEVYDHISNTWVSRIEMLTGPGDCLGDVELLERCNRRHTYTTTNEVELLVVFHEDFERVLRPVMEKQWLEKKSALMALDYFKFFSTDQIINACKLCILRQFEPLETIYYEDKGQLSYVHFVLSGECMILQCLEMMATQRKGKKTFELVELSKDNVVRLFQGLSNAELLKILRNESYPTSEGAHNIDQLIESEDDVSATTSKTQSRDLRKTDIRSIEIKCGLLEPDSVSSSTSTSNTYFFAERGEKNVSLNDDLLVEHEYKDLRDLSEETEIMQYEQLEGGEEDLDDRDADIKSRSVMPSKSLQQRVNQSKERLDAKDKLKTHKSKKQKNIQELADVKEEDRLATEYPSSSDKRSRSLKHEGKFNGEKRESKFDRKRSVLNALRQSIRSSKRNSATRGASALPNAQHVSRKLENHFIDVGSLTFGGIFGIGEKLEHRVIMARTAVQCLMIPRFWLFEKDQNPGNIWQRRRFYLDTTIPSRETLFKDFLTTRQWQKFKDDLIQGHLNPNSISNPTKIQDIPIICRLVEANND